MVVSASAEFIDIIARELVNRQDVHLRLSTEDALRYRSSFQQITDTKMMSQEEALRLIEAITASLRWGAMHYDQSGKLLFNIEEVLKALLDGPVTVESAGGEIVATLVSE